VMVPNDEKDVDVNKRHEKKWGEETRSEEDSVCFVFYKRPVMTIFALVALFADTRVINK